MKRTIISLLILTSILLVACERAQTENSSKAETESSEIVNDSSEEIKDSWIETETLNGKKVTRHYRNFGKEWTTTIERFDNSGTLTYKEVIETIDDKVTKTDKYDYGEAENEYYYHLCEEKDNDGKTIKRIYEYSIDGFCESKDHNLSYDDSGKEFVIEGKEKYYNPETNAVYAEVDIFCYTAYGEEFIVKNTTFYKNGVKSHIESSYTKKYETEVASYVYCNLDEEPIYEINRVDDIEFEIYYKDSGRIEFAKFDGYITMAYISNSNEAEHIANIYPRPNSEVSEISMISDNYTYDDALALLSYCNNLYADIIEYIDNVDYRPDYNK